MVFVWALLAFLFFGGVSEVAAASGGTVGYNTTTKKTVPADLNYQADTVTAGTVTATNRLEALGDGVTEGAVEFWGATSGKANAVQAHPGQTTNINLIFPIAPRPGLWVFLVDQATNLVATNAVIYDSREFRQPARCDGVGGVMITNDYTLAGFGQVTLSGSEGTNANWVEYNWIVPSDFDGSEDPILETWAFATTGTGISSATFHVGMASVTASAEADPTSFSNWIAMTTGTLIGAAAGDIFYIHDQTLTDWGASMTSKQKLKIRIQRDGAGDGNDDGLTTQGLTIRYLKKLTYF